MANPHDWEQYAQNLFVGHDGEIAACSDWVTSQRTTRQLRSYIGAAGTGKTWLMQRLYGEFRDAKAPAVNLLPIWLSWPHLAHDYVSGVDIYTAAVRTLLEIECRELSNHYPDLSALPDDVEAKVLAEIVSDILCDRLDLRPVLFVEGYDEVEEPLAVTFAEDLLYPFITKSTARVIMGRRDENLDGVDVLRWTEEAQQLEAAITPGDQLERLIQAQYPGMMLQLAEIEALVPNYGWNHPYINAYFFHCALSKTDRPLNRRILEDDQRVCCRQLIERGSRPPLDEDQFKLLCRIAHDLGREWTEEEFEQTLQMRLDQIELFFEYGAIRQTSQTSHRYHIVDGLYQLLANLP